MVDEKLQLIAQTFNSTTHDSNQAIALGMLKAGGYEVEDLAKHVIETFFYPKPAEAAYVFIGKTTVRIARAVINKNKWYKSYPTGRYTIQIGYDISTIIETDHSNLRAKLNDCVAKIIKRYEKSKI